jgi:hypothetical protein
MAFSFNPDQYLAVASDKGTVHIFHMSSNEESSGTSKSGTSGTSKPLIGTESRPAVGSSPSSSMTSSFTKMVLSTVRKSVEGVASVAAAAGVVSSSSATGSTAANHRSGANSEDSLFYRKSICQIRGVPHPLSVSFVADASPTLLLAVAGWDADGNG